MQANKVKWVGIDDDFLVPPQDPTDKSIYEIALGP